MCDFKGVSITMPKGQESKQWTCNSALQNQAEKVSF